MDVQQKAARKNFRAALRKKKKNEEDAGDDEWQLQAAYLRMYRVPSMMRRAVRWTATPGDDDVVQGLGGVIQIGVHGHDTGGMADADGLLAGLENDQLMTRVPGTNAATLMEEALVSGQAL